MRGIPRLSVSPRGRASALAGLSVHDHLSPNFGPRRDGARIELIVLHFTAMRSADEALERLCDPAHEVSAHYLIDARGLVLRLVPDTERAWHAGHGAWGGRGDVNSRSLGIELANSGTAPFAAAQMDALEQLLGGLLARHGLPPEAVIAHQDMAPTRKTDPGPRFDWRRLALGGLSIWPDAAEADPAGFYSDLTAFGYPDAPEAARLAAFRARFRPRHDGPVDAVDAGMARDLATRFPVDRSDATA